MSDPQPPQDPKQRGSITGTGVALIVIGLVILVPSGLCTGTFGVLGIVEAVQSKNWGDSVWGVLGLMGFCAIPMLLGIGLIRTGMRDRRKK